MILHRKFIEYADGYVMLEKVFIVLIHVLLASFTYCLCMQGHKDSLNERAPIAENELSPLEASRIS